jgi:hypothetical protein
MESEAEMGSLNQQQQHHLAPVAGTTADNNDMKRMGKVQELNVSCVHQSDSLHSSSLIIYCQRLYTISTLVGYAVIVAMTWPLAMMYV